LQKGFYQTPQKKEKQIEMISKTWVATKEKRSKITIQQSSSDDTSSEDETRATSPSKYIAANTSLLELAPKARELLDLITACKELVKYVKIVSKKYTGRTVILLLNEISFYSDRTE
jgi:hypothetical protein